eukprot:gene33285-17477_t
MAKPSHHGQRLQALWEAACRRAEPAAVEWIAQYDVVEAASSRQPAHPAAALHEALLIGALHPPPNTAPQPPAQRPEPAAADDSALQRPMRAHPACGEAAVGVTSISGRERERERADVTDSGEGRRERADKACFFPRVTEVQEVDEVGASATHGTPPLLSQQQEQEQGRAQAAEAGAVSPTSSSAADARSR